MREPFIYTNSVIETLADDRNSVPSTLVTSATCTFASGGYSYVNSQASYCPGGKQFSLRARVSPTNPATGASQALMSWWQQGGSNSSAWMLYITASGLLSVAWVSVAGVLNNAVSASAPVFPNSAPLWLRADVDPIGGLVSFMSSRDGSTWASLGTYQTPAAGLGPVRSPSGTSVVLGQAYAGALPFAGDFYAATLIIGGQTVLSPVASFSGGCGGFVDVTGAGWTTNLTLAAFRQSIVGCSVKMRGVALYPPNWPYIAEMWFKFDWAGFIKPAIDAAFSIGANVLKFNVDGVGNDGVAPAAFVYPSDVLLQARIKKVCDYAASLGMGVYVQLGYQPQHIFGADGKSVASGTAAAVKIAGWVDSIPNVLAIDTLNEWDVSQPSTWGTSGSGLAQALADLTSYMAAIRAVTSKPLTISALNIANLAQVAPLVDYHDVHYYYYNQADAVFRASFVSSLQSASYYKGAFVLGETGMPGAYSSDQSACTFTPSQQSAWMSGAPSMISLPDCVGGFCWTLVDTFGPGLQPGNWGMFSQGFSAPRTALTSAFSTWPKTF